MQDCAGTNNALGSMGTVVFLVKLGIVFDHKVELALCDFMQHQVTVHAFEETPHIDIAHTQWHIGIYGRRCTSYV